MAMALRSAGRTLSYEILSQSSSIEDDEALFLRPNSDPFHNHSAPRPNRKKRKKRKKKTTTTATTTTTIEIESSIPEEPINGNDREVDSSVSENFGIARQAFQVSGNGDSCCSIGLESNCEGYSVMAAKFVRSGSGGSVCTVTTVTEQPGFQNVRGELRQRTVNGSGGGAGDGGLEDSASRVYSEGKLETDIEVNSAGKQRTEPNGTVLTKLETAESLDWKKLMSEDPNYMFSSEKSPFKYFYDDMLGGNSLRRTTTFGNEKERERVYDTIFRLPWRCELLINVGFFVCFDSFLSLLTIMPTRILTSIWRFIKTRQFKQASAAELSDFGCFVIMVCGVFLLERTDISLIYHMIRGQGTIKLYVVYNVLEIFDKLCQSFNGDVLQTLFNSADGLANSPPDGITFWIWRYVCDLTLAVVASIIHSFILLAQAITLSTCIVAHNNALLALLVSNNFAEIKSNVFKRYSRENIHSLVYFDSVERFHISAFVLFVLAQNILEAEGPWFESFLSNALLVYVCEMVIDIIKHSFIAKFNDIKPIAYSEFLEDLCKQILHIDTEDSKNILTFIPLAPACVVIRVLTPVYAACLPCHPLPWKLFWIVLLFSVNFVMLTSLKVLIGMGLQKHATWYVNRCRKRKHHLHCD
ncbi:protein POLLEN DEFECTIVE IN GUIDANCE 1 isoform X2 [Humulus lupulus]|uniref:protein POLLEN DEFECTIVE IN GUIDANCE 1 isoform X2 n=1 Tax=Humulus lupulus TaxID=3486 RepID=UPI002B40E85B|nr:protein POLLEN DEFECTIVE IN GUIDANCE 1 isoform X2 [Humulus lupulus]